METLYINGKFFCQETTGVQRFAIEVLRAIDLALSKETTSSWIEIIILIPDNGCKILPEFKRIKTKLTWWPFLNHLWEQIYLPLSTLNKPLLNLSGSAPILKKKQVCTFHDAAVFDIPAAYRKTFVLWYKFLFKYQANTSLGIITVSDFSRSRLIHHLHMRKDKISVVYNGADHIDPSQTSRPAEQDVPPLQKPYLMAVGSLNPSKNLPSLIEGYGKSHAFDMGYTLVVVGGSNPLFAKIKTDNVNGVIWTGRLSDLQLKSTYSNAYAFVFPSLYEGFGIPPLEAMALGCPVLASRTASIPEVCGAAALYFDPHDIDSIKESIEKIIDMPELIPNMVRAGFSQAALFTWEKSAVSLLANCHDFKLISRPGIPGLGSLGPEQDPG